MTGPFTQQLLQSAFIFFLFNLIVNILIALILRLSGSERVYSLILKYWVSILFTAVVNLIFLERFQIGLLIGALGTFTSQSLLGGVLAEVTGVRVRLRPILFFSLLCFAASYALFGFGAPFPVYATCGALGASAPFFYFLYHALRERRGPLSLVQKLFVYVATFQSLHYLDYGVFKPDARLFLIGSLIAFFILNILSILIPMVVNEHQLYVRNTRLEEEIQARAGELTQAKESLWEAAKLASLGRMAGGVAHELNNPLFILSLRAERIQAKAKSGKFTEAALLEDLQGIHHVIERISAMTDVLRRLARDRMTSQREALDVSRILQEIVHSHRARAEAEGISLDLEIAAGDFHCWCDKREISELFGHLIDNALDAVQGTAHPWVRIHAALEPSYLSISFTDSGRIPSETAKRLMEPFFTTKPMGEGAGLGLSISKAIAEAHGGTVTWDSESPNTRFVVTLSRQLR